MAGFLVLVALSRWPGLLPPSFSVVYALVFCAGVYFPAAMAWWLPLSTLKSGTSELVFTLSTKPNLERGKAAGDRPPAFTE